MSRRNLGPSNHSCASFSRCGKVGTLTLRGRLSLEEAEEVLIVARKALADGDIQSVRLNCDALETAGLASLQILLALRQGLEESERTLDIPEEIPNGIRRSFQLVGLCN